MLKQPVIGSLTIALLVLVASCGGSSQLDLTSEQPLPGTKGAMAGKAHIPEK